MCATSCLVARVKRVCNAAAFASPFRPLLAIRLYKGGFYFTPFVKGVGGIYLDRPQVGCRTCTKCDREAERLNASAFNDIHSILRCFATLYISVFFFLVQYSFFWLRCQKKEYWCRVWGCKAPNIKL